MRTIADLQRSADAPPAPAGLTLPVDRVQRDETPGFPGTTFLEVTTKTALNRVTGMPFEWSINPYRGCTMACRYCFARPSHTYLGLDPGEQFETSIVVKVNVVEVLRAELSRPSWRGHHVALGTNTDPYQRAEGRYRLMPGIIDALAASWTPFSILTKGTLITRDLDRLVTASQRVPVAASVTVGVLDEAVWRSAEPGTPSPRARLDAVRRLNAAGIPTGVMLAPIMPGMTDDPDQLTALAEAAVEAGATHVTPIVLHLRPGVKPVFMAWLAQAHPHLVGRYEGLYGRRASLPREVADPLLQVVRRARDAAWRRRGGMPDPGPWLQRGSRRGESATGHRVVSASAAGTAAEQLSLLG